MLERSNPVLRLLCLGLLALMLIQAVRLVAHKDPLANARVPAPPAEWSGTNAPPAAKITNATAAAKTTNALVAMTTNALVATKTTNAPAGGKTTNAPPRPGLAPQMGAMKKEPDLPPEVQARADRIIQSEIFGMVPRPLPMALLGIAGVDAFIRAPNGQTGLVREGGELGGLKLLRIGTNRVLIEHEGQKKELSLFSGLGGESLMPKGKENPQ